MIKRERVRGMTVVGGPQWREGERSEPEPNGGVPTTAREFSVRPNQVNDEPDPEVSEKPVRRRLTAKYKLKILRDADRCTKPGQLGALLRREGLYYSYLSLWRRQREKGELRALEPRKRGRKSTGRHDPVVEENRKLRREIERLQQRLKKAETIIEVQKKVSEMLGIAQSSTEPGEDD